MQRPTLNMVSGILAITQAKVTIEQYVLTLMQYKSINFVDVFSEGDTGDR